MTAGTTNTGRGGAIAQALVAASVVGGAATVGWPASLGAAVIVAAWVWTLARRAGRLDAGVDGAAAPQPTSAPDGVTSPAPCADLVARVVDLQLDYLRDLDSRRVFPRAVADLQTLSGAAFAAICEVRVSSSGRRYTELIESDAVCWSDSVLGGEASAAFRATSRDLTPVLDAVLETGRSVVVSTEAPLPGLSSGFVAQGCLAVPLTIDDRIVGVVALGASERRSLHELVESLSPLFRVCAGLIDAAKHQDQHQRLVEESKARETLYRDLFDSASDLIHAVRPDGGFAYVNKAWLQTLGYAEHELEDLRVWDVVDEAAHTFYRTVFALASPGAPPEPRRMTFIAKSGRRIAVEGAEGCRFVDGVPAVTRAIFRDVTRRNAEEDALRAAKAAAEEAARAKGLFLANMSHELRTPMNAVIGMTDLLADTGLSADQRELVGTIRRAGESLLDIINNVLDFSKIESGKLQLERVPFDLREAIEHAVDLVAQPALDKGLEIGYLLAPGVVDSVVGDVTRFKQILINLVTNAVKFTSAGEVTITVDGHAKESDYELYVRVRDTGIGIPEDRVSQLFQSFSQVDAGTTREFGGTGLGLAICRRLAELMGGNIWVESKLGVGSVFHFTVLVKAAPRHSSRESAQNRVALAGQRALIVAAGPTTRRMLLDHTSAWGMTPSAFVNAVQAIADLEMGSEYDLVIVDTHPDFEEAVGLVAELRSRAAFARVPLVLLGGPGRAGERIEGVQRYAWATKPIKRATLLRAIGEAADGHSASNGAATDVSLTSRPHRLLLTEDNPINQQVASRMLARLGFVADVADNGAAAVDAVARSPYDIVLMDVQMPILDGFSATARIRQGGGRQPYIIGMTALALAGDRERCLAAGMDDYVSKPIRPELLQAALERAVVSRSAPSSMVTAVEPAASSEPVTAPIEAAAVTSGPPEDRVQSASASVFDPTAIDKLHELAAGDKSFARGLVQKWLRDYPQRIDEIAAALDSGDMPRAERVAHTLKSSCGILGAVRMAAACQQIETASAGGELARARAGVTELRDAARETEPFLGTDAAAVLERPA